MHQLFDPIFHDAHGSSMLLFPGRRSKRESKEGNPPIAMSQVVIGSKFRISGL